MSSPEQLETPPVLVPEAAPGLDPAAGRTRRIAPAGSVRQMMRQPFVVVVSLLLLWFIGTMLVWPNLNLLAETFIKDGALSTSAVERLGKSARAMTSLKHSFLLAVALCVCTNLVGVFIVLVTHFFDIRGARLLWLGYATTFIYGGIVLASAYKMLYGTNGPLGRLVASVVPGLGPGWFTGFGAVLFTMTLATTTNHLLFVSSALAGIDGQMLESARMMGASTSTILRRIVLPMLKPVLFAVTILSFLTGLGALSAPQVLGGRGFQTIAPMILTFSTTRTSRDIAALLAIILGVATMALLAILTRIERSGMYFSVSKVSAKIVKQKIRNPIANTVVHVLAWGLWLLYVAPVVLVVLFSFMPPDAIGRGELDLGRISLDNYARVLTGGSALRPFLVSIVYSALAALIVGLAMMIVSWIVQRYRNPVTTVLEALLHIPWILPATMIALGLIMSYDHPSPLVLGRVLTGTPVILLLAYVIVKVPFTLRILKSAFAALNLSLEEAASLMGAGPLTVFRRILFPAVLPAAAAVTALNFNSLLDDYDTAVFLAHPLFQPLGLVIQANTTGQVGPDAAANTFVYTVLLMLITGGVMWLVYGRQGKRRHRR
ncbi:iron ABC transporter permease [Luteococcus peritonei]|uniref:ABC transporter permease n=1 Tax=Luteococcus peritonei TaxID=88874 RepID=A0ABW4RUG3_9ACTN